MDGQCRIFSFHFISLNVEYCLGPTHLFGWSMSHFQEGLYIGAPLEDQEKGALYKCSNLERTPTCQKVLFDIASFFKISILMYRQPLPQI